jgi:hypothetical protein
MLSFSVCIFKYAGDNPGINIIGEKANEKTTENTESHPIERDCPNGAFMDMYLCSYLYYI